MAGRWLRKLTNTGASGWLDLPSKSEGRLLELMSNGADGIMRYRRNPNMPGFVHGDPVEGIAVIHDDNHWNIFLSGMISLGFAERRWVRHQFYYRCKDLPKIRETRAWRTVAQAVGQHEIEPVLVMEKDVFVFGGDDWMLCEVKLCLA